MYNIRDCFIAGSKLLLKDGDIQVLNEIIGKTIISAELTTKADMQHNYYLLLNFSDGTHFDLPINDGED